METYKVNTNLRSLVFGESEGNLFSFGEDIDVQQPSQVEEKSIELVNGTNTALFSNFIDTKYFWFHFDNSNSNRSLAESLKPFARKDTLENIHEKWKVQKEELTIEFKKKHKSAFGRTKKLRVSKK
ncbi:hypothetical protein BC833DRAFT_645620 [Globomyces pollinis-pini]|nr:hypothetical protein BC833DRAFT_645620 [Globomyces pollinis-pini]